MHILIARPLSLKNVNSNDVCFIGLDSFKCSFLLCLLFAYRCCLLMNLFENVLHLFFVILC